MVPRIIHYCWLGGNEIPQPIAGIMKSWKRVMPDYEIKLWNESNFDINSIEFVCQAYNAGKWAFASDYIRLWALYNEGGIYLDTDVLIRKRFDDFLKHDFFSSVEYHQHVVDGRNSDQFIKSDGKRKDDAVNVPGIGIQSAIIGSVKENEFIRDCMDYYKVRKFILDNDQFNNKIIAPDIFAIIAEKYGFIYRDVKQELAGNMVIYPSRVFAGSKYLSTDDSHAVHYCTGSWKDKPYITLTERVKRKLVQMVRKMF